MAQKVSMPANNTTAITDELTTIAILLPDLDLDSFGAGEDEEVGEMEAETVGLEGELEGKKFVEGFDGVVDEEGVTEGGAVVEDTGEIEAAGVADTEGVADIEGVGLGA